jgi:hypothetical protein
LPATDDADGHAKGPDPDAERRDQRDATMITSLAVVLTLATGATDVASFTRLGGVFASLMTGNLVLFGLAVGRPARSRHVRWWPSPGTRPTWPPVAG